MLPRNVRNFYLDCFIDGRQTNLSGGPASKDGGFTLSLFQRDSGAVTTPITITGFASPDGTLMLSVKNAQDEIIFEHNTKR